VVAAAVIVAVAAASAAFYFFYGVRADRKAVWGGGAEPFSREAAGSVSDPYVIDAAEKLAYLSQQVAGGENFAGKHFLLASDIDLNGAAFNWTPIGGGGNLFAGGFDGNGKSISNMRVYLPDAENAALFGAMRGSVVNLNIISADVTGKSQVGALAGLNFGGTVKNSAADGTVNGGSLAGGLVGNNLGGEISNCLARGKVNGDRHIGGLVGLNSGSVTGGVSDSAVGGNEYVGGLVGDNAGKITAGIASGGVVGKGRYVGALIGRNEGASAADSVGSAKVLIEVPEMTNFGAVSAVINDLRNTKAAALMYYLDYGEWPGRGWPDGASLDAYLDFPLFGSGPDGPLYGLSVAELVINASTGSEKTLIGFDLETGENAPFMNSGARESLKRESRSARLLNENGGLYDGGRFIYILLK
jgi:hypothetical protein